MSFFGKTERDDRTGERAAADAYAADVLIPLAKEAEAKLLAEAGGALAAMMDEAERQKEGFTFTCKRHGDFLSLFCTRLANDSAEWGPGKEFSTTINLSLVSAIDPQIGHAPDRNGSTGYSVGLCSDNGGGWKSSSGRPTGPPGKGWHHEVIATVGTSVPAHRGFFSLPKAKTDLSSHHISMGGGLSYQTSNLPRGAEDDVIWFRGIDARLFVPFGLGRATLDTILAEFSAFRPA